MLSVFHPSNNTNRQDIDFALLIITVWNVESSSDLLSPPDAIVIINNYSNLQLYQDTQCQLAARLGQLSWEGAEH
ncbi:Hypothetical protein PHPALM_6055 [Phytophthora palmivora]|uniref:Uncharacterized protein n=1 Tax=Phytophthora palmivora TaxID=4796 RepID=A0A2P4YFW6_9STRA|nr:Hypothetical protein PHPALM_6055 [Phytophthora palmivora]